ncbi:MAG: hypothetical protein M3384_01020 [Acidobacteriota bacterium]|nr:hypothetical protein [Acidobacteriota bacterium]
MQNIKFTRPKKTLVICLSLLLTVFCSLLTANAQRRDHLTEQEGDLIREAQELDRRIDVLTKAIDRRVMVLNGRQAELKDVEKWGEPKGTKAQLLHDISRILLSAIDNIEYVAEKDAANKLFPKSIHNLAATSRKLLPQLETYRGQSTDKMEQAAILTAIDYCNQIIEASTKVPKEAPKEEKKKKSSSSKDD